MVHSLAFMEENIRLLAAKPAGECVAASDPLAFTRIEQEVGGDSSHLKFGHWHCGEFQFILVHCGRFISENMSAM